MQLSIAYFPADVFKVTSKPGVGSVQALLPRCSSQAGMPNAVN
jgi:hypothetical protein